MAKRSFTTAERDAYKAAKREESRELLEQAARELLTSDGWRAWADTRAKFHRYSFGNCMLIACQRPDATRVAGFRKWQGLERQVRKGEKAIRILAPMKVTHEDEDTGDKRSFMRYRAVSVFDIAQTDGEALPECPGDDITGDSHAHLLPKLEALAATIGWTVEYGPTLPADGWAQPRGKRIMIGEHLTSPNRQVRTLIHELVHAQGLDYSEHNRPVCEVLTETAAYVACRSLGLDTAGMSVPYVAGWSHGTLDDIKAHAARVDELARVIETACE